MIEQKIVDILTLTERAIRQYAPVAWQKAMELYWYKAAIQAVQATIIFGLGTTLLLVSWRLVVLWNRREHDPRDEMVTPIIMATAGVVFTLVGMISLSEVHWLALLRPDLAVIADILKRLVK